MDKQPIVVKRWKVYLRRLLDEVKRPFRVWLIRIRRLRRDRRPSVKINISKPAAAGNGRPARARQAVVKVADRRPPSPHAQVPAPGRQVGPARRRLRRKASGGNISVTDGLRLCRACGLSLIDGEELSECRLDRSHVIHKACISLMKHKCPDCGGPVL